MMATFKKILESLNLSESEASDKAKKAGLVSKGGGAYAKEKGGPTVAKSVDGELVSVSGGGKEKEPKKEKPEKLSDDELKDKLVDDEVSKIMNFEDRITDLEARARWKEESGETTKQIEALENVRESIKTLDGSYRDRAALLQAVGFLYTGRSNSGIGKNNLGLIDRDQLNKNKETLIAGYDDAIPEKVEKYVRSVRKNKVSERFVDDSYNALPKPLQAALKRKGRAGDDAAKGGGHFLGYNAVSDGKTYTTSDVNDPNIQKGKDGKPEAVRGNTGTTERAKVCWRIYLEQGGVDAYTGLPLDIEEMDLEHVVGFQNKDKGKPTGEDYANREHEANQVMCSSRANQQKTDLSMKDFFETRVDPLNDKTPDDFKALDKGLKQANEITTTAEQVALSLQGDIRYKVKGGGDTTNPDDPNVVKSDAGTPKVADATLGENVTAPLLVEHFRLEDEKYDNIKKSLLGEGGAVTDPDDVKKIKGLKSKIGRRTLQAMGLPRGVLDPSGRRSVPISGTDNYYRNFLGKMAAKPYKERQKFKDGWQEGMLLVGSKEVRSKAKTEKGFQRKVFDLYLAGDGAELKKLGVDVNEKTLKTRGNLMEEQVKPQYESLEGTISRMKR
jgi:hypothetical protein